MGSLIGDVIETEVQDGILRITIDSGGGVLSRCPQFTNAGDDSRPLPDDKAVAVRVPGEGRKVVLGYIDLKNLGVAKEGEKRIYSRDSDGNIQAEIILENNGSITVKNGNGSMTINQSGAINLNGVVIDVNGNISTSGTLEADEVTATNKNVTLSTHQHPGNNLPPTPGT